MLNPLYKNVESLSDNQPTTPYPTLPPPPNQISYSYPLEFPSNIYH